MAETQKETILRASLKKALGEWLSGNDHQSYSLSYVGNECASAMADAAFAVLQGMADLEQYHKQESGLSA